MTWPSLPEPRPDDGDAVGESLFAESHPALDELLAVLTEEPRPVELDGLTQALSAYRAAVPVRISHASTARRASVLTGLLTAKAAAALGGAVVALGATAMVVTLSLPHNGADRPPVSPAARTLAATPAPTETDDGEGVGPDATGPAAHGLCTAWSRHQANGSAEALNSVAMRNLAKAAGGANRVEAYCATIKHPGKGSSRDAKNRDDKDKGKSATAPHGPRPKPSANSRSKPSTPASPTGKPTPQTSPSTSPTPSPTGSAT